MKKRAENDFWLSKFAKENEPDLLISHLQFHLYL